MSMLKPFLIALVFSLILDGAWMGLMRKFYRKELGPLLRKKLNGDLDPKLWSAVFVYVLIALGIVAFVLPRNGGPGIGFLFGVVLYGVYEYTNYALVKDWSIKLLFVDVLWGGVLCAIVADLTLRTLA